MRQDTVPYLPPKNSVIFDDAVVYGGWCVDLHAAHGLLDFDLLPSDCHHFLGVYTIPYRSYYSKNIKNLFMAGRDISTTKLGDPCSGSTCRNYYTVSVRRDRYEKDQDSLF